MKARVQVPVSVYPERVWRTYRGGRYLDLRQGKAEAVDSYYPEEWILSTVSARTAGGRLEGLCTAEDEGMRQPLSELLKGNPQRYLGKNKAKAFSGGLDVLTKVIDAAERLSIQVHPDRAMARSYFHSPFGKMESWHILGVRAPDSCIYLGFRPGVTRTDWEACFWRQDIEGMLNRLHRIPVQPGDTFLVPGGMPHAIGSGCLLLEIQEPTDFTLRTECRNQAGQAISEALIHQGIGFERMFDCFDYTGVDSRTLMRRCRLLPGQKPDRNGFVQLVGPPHTNCFTLKYQEVESTLSLQGEESYYGLYVWTGSGSLDDGRCRRQLLPGSQLFVPAGCGSFILHPVEKLKLFKIEGGKYE